MCVHVRKAQTRISTKQTCYIERIGCLVVSIERRVFSVEGRYRKAVRPNKCLFANYPPTDNVLKFEPSQPQEGAQDGFDVGSNGLLSEFARCLSQSHDARQPISSQGIGRFDILETVAILTLPCEQFVLEDAFGKQLYASGIVRLANCLVFYRASFLGLAMKKTHARKSVHKECLHMYREWNEQSFFT